MHRRILVQFLFALLLISILLIGCASAEQEPAAITTASESSAGAAPSFDDGVPRNDRDVPRMPVEELKTRLDNGDSVVVADNRSENMYESGHIPGAIWVPSVNVDSPIDDLALDQEIVLYCN